RDPRFCDAGRCTDPCRADGDCPQGQACNLDTGRCFIDGGGGDECIVDDVDCRDPRFCDAGRCTNPCRADGDCAQGQRCSPAGLCATTTAPTYCCDKAGCPAGSACVDVNGTQGQCGGTGPIIPCFNHCGCPQGQTCTGGQCRTAGTPTYCCDTAGCPSGAACVSGNNAPGTCP
ncbi:MAG: hypothetical protein KC503_35960, partial [Myxococcales bacterium]|nr:hypothetical protein [Myxococcales bacterium]